MKCEISKGKDRLKNVEIFYILIYFKTGNYSGQ